MLIARVTSYCLLHELRVPFPYELQVTVYCTSYILTMSYNKDIDDEIVFDNKLMIKNYSLKLLFDKKIGVR